MAVNAEVYAAVADALAATETRIRRPLAQSAA
jgi:hypothetical protein